MRSGKALSLVLFVVVFLLLLGLVWEASICDVVPPNQIMSTWNACEGDAPWRGILSQPSKVYDEYLGLSLAEKSQMGERFWNTLWGSCLTVCAIIAIALVWLIVGSVFRPFLTGGYNLLWTLQVIPFLSYASVLGAVSFRLDMPLSDNLALGIVIGLFPMISELVLGVSKIPDDDVELLRVYKASFLRRLTILFFPKLSASFFSGLYVAVPLAIVGVTLGDLYGGEKAGLGQTVAYYLKSDMDKVWMATFGIIVISLAILALVALIERLFSRRFPWYRRGA